MGPERAAKAAPAEAGRLALAAPAAAESGAVLAPEVAAVELAGAALEDLRVEALAEELALAAVLEVVQAQVKVEEFEQAESQLVLLKVQPFHLGYPQMHRLLERCY